MKIALGSFQIFQKFAEKFASQSAPPVSTTLVAHLPPIPLVLLIPVAKNKIRIFP
jgi:hypothetical protein